MAKTRAVVTARAEQLLPPAPSEARQPSTIVVPEGRPAGASGDIRIERLIIHELDNRTRHTKIAESEILLDAENREYFIKYIRDTAMRADWRAGFADARGDVPTYCRQLLTDAEQFVQASQALAHRLFQQMLPRPHTIVPGDFVVVIYSADDRPGRHIALLKLHPERRLGVDFKTVEGRTRAETVAAEHLLPDFNRLQKCALLTLPSAASDFDLTLFDAQAGPQSDGVAAFFYRGFLTADLGPSARRRTRLFLSATEDWVGTQAAQMLPTQLLAFYRARRVALAGDRVDLVAFARAALPHSRALQENVVVKLRRALFGSTDAALSSFGVDRATADPVVNTVTLELDGNLRIKVDAREFDRCVRVAERRTSEQKVQITIESLTLKEVTAG
jgi:hypothetical protein